MVTELMWGHYCIKYGTLVYYVANCITSKIAQIHSELDVRITMRVIIALQVLFIRI